MCRYTLATSGTCNAILMCDTGTLIKITTVEYRDTRWCLDPNCGLCCYRDLQISTEYKISIAELCNNHHKCNLDSWNPNKIWEMKITYVCGKCDYFFHLVLATSRFAYDIIAHYIDFYYMNL